MLQLARQWAQKQVQTQAEYQATQWQSRTNSLPSLNTLAEDHTFAGILEAHHDQKRKPEQQDRLFEPPEHEERHDIKRSRSDGCSPVPETELQNQNQVSQQSSRPTLEVNEQAHRLPSISTNTFLLVHFGEQKDFAPSGISASSKRIHHSTTRPRKRGLSIISSTLF